MVISYSIEELTAIGELVTLRECLVATSNNNNNNNHINSLYLNSNKSNLQLHHHHQHQQQQLNHSLNFINSLCCQINSQLNANNCQPQSQSQTQIAEQSPPSPDSTEVANANPDGEKPLARSVADFFRLAQQNFYKTIIDPTKVRSLSEVEAELLSTNSFNL